MRCLCSGEQLNAEEMVPSSDCQATKDGSISGYSSQIGEGEQRIDMGNIEEAESSLREGGCLNYEVSPVSFTCFLGSFAADSFSYRNNKTRN